MTQQNTPSINDWKHFLFAGYCDNIFHCCFGTFFPPCAIASAKSHFDGSDCVFNCVCFGLFPGVVRNYIRQGYDIKGRAGISDCFLPMFCSPCVNTQLLNEVTTRGPHIFSVLQEQDSPWTANQQDFSCIGDPCDFCMTYLFGYCETANIYSQLAGVPLWFALFPGCPCPVNICQTQHLLRKSYGIGGNDCYDDCFRPTLCLCIPYISQVYFYKEITSLRAEYKYRGKPGNFMKDNPY